MRQAVGVALVSLCGCVTSDADSASWERGRAAIIGGVETTGDAPVVMTQTTTGQCTGTLIAPRVVLTAAHCVIDSIENGQTGVGQVSFGTGFGDFFAEVGIRDMIAHRRYDPNAVTSYDVAVIRLDEDAPESVTPMPYNSAPITEDFLGTELRVVGFGVSDGENQSGGGVKRQVSLTIDEITAHHIGIGNETRNICQGDSGGPAIAEIGGEDTVMSVSSFGSNFCMNRSYVTRTDVFAETFLGPVVAAWSGPCQSDGSCVTEGCGEYVDPDCDPCGLDGTCATGCPDLDLDCPLSGLAGETCEDSDGCESRLCVEALDDPRIRYCSHECDPAEPAPCEPPLNLCREDDDGVHRCYFGGTTPGAQGASCEDGGECRSGLCDGDEGICVEPCGDDLPACPAPYECVEKDDLEVCSLEDDGGCAASGSRGSRAAPSGSLLLFLLGLVVLGWRRRRAVARDR